MRAPLNTPYKITSGYIARGDYQNYRTVFGRQEPHEALDIINVNNDRRVYPILDGVVILAEWDDNAGDYIILQHYIHNEIKYSKYCHIEQLLCKKSDTVNVNNPIGYYGQVGRSTGAHLHYEVFDGNWQRLNPSKYL